MGSTRLWEENPAAMGRALARHDALVREAMAAHGGQTLRTAGDAFTLRFDSVQDAVGAAIQAQRALRAEAWPTKEPLRVRMAIDVGDELDGPSLVRFERLLVRAHGGQTLLSERARTEDTVRLEEGVYALRAPGLEEEFPPLRPLFEEPPVPNNLPAPATSFVGREAELARVVKALAAASIENAFLPLLTSGTP